MALQLKDKTYLKIDAEGNYIIYKNKTARNKEKKINSQEIIDKYIEILNSYDVSTEAIYYAPDIFKEYEAWKEECTKYVLALQERHFKFEFPLMAKYFPNINDSLPVIIKKGKTGVPKNKTTKEIYEYVKQYEFFGKIDEVKDI